MKVLLLSSVMFGLLISPFVQARTVEVDVHGMTCSFCVDSLERKFGAMDTVSKVDVSLKLKKIRLETEDSLPTEETIKQAVLDAGFTPVKVTILDDGTTKSETSSTTAKTNNDANKEDK